MTDKQRLLGRRTSGARASGVLAELGPGLLVMDVASTLIEQEVIELIAEHAGTREQVADITERAMRGELDFAASLRQRVSTLAGVNRTIFADVLDQVRLTPGAEELIARLHASGCRVGIVSGGFAEVVGPLATRLGIDHMAANRLETSEGVLTGRVEGRIVDRGVKKQCLRDWAAEDGVDMRRTVAVGDGANDLSMFEHSNLKIAFCAKPILRQAATCCVDKKDLREIINLI